jgi:hypothetical protein
MASSTPHVIVLQTNEEGAARPVMEGLATPATIKPGHLIEWSSGKLILHANDDAPGAPMFAVENPFYKPTTTEAAIDHAYAADETVRFVWAQPGDQIYAFLETGNNATKGLALTSDGAGGLQITPAAGAIIAYADEDLNNTTGSQARLKVRVA